MSTPPAAAPTPDATDEMVAEIVNAFLKWPLPETVSSDPCCNRPGKGRVGTNLLTCPETVAMVQEVVRPILERELAARDAEIAELRKDRERLINLLCFCDGIFSIIQITKKFRLEAVDEARRRIDAAKEVRP